MALDLAPQLRRFAPVPLDAAATRMPSGVGVESAVRRRWLSVALIILVAIGTMAGLAQPGAVTGAPLVPIVVAAGLFLAGTAMYAVFAAAGGALLITSIHTSTPPTTVAAVAVVMLLMIAVERRRNRIGIPSEVSTSMLVELRERLSEQGDLPHDMPDGWHVDSSIEPAHGEAFSGDFMVTHRSDDDVLELVLVDVEGSGLLCGSRSLMLSGAFSGLLGATAHDQFLPAANRYLVRQGWSDGCATAVHLALDLRTGEYTVGSAGHPAAMHFHAGAGRWSARTDASGVMLGVLDSDLVTYERASGRLERGDALLLYTDGVVESPRCDLRQGMDRMLGVADRVVTGAPHAGDAAQICEVALAGESDDRSAVLIRRAA